MMFDLHTHTTFSDGNNTPEEMVAAAIRMGCEKIGFSDHSYTAFDERYCIAKSKIGEYRRTVLELKEKYKGKIEILLGIEQDYYSDEPTDAYDYVIGSVHYLKIGDEYIPVDDTPEILTDAVNRYFDGDFYELAKLYFETEADVARRTNADIIGHFDLIRKFNRGGILFDEKNEKYRLAAKNALDKLLSLGVPFEINTGAISRGYLDDPYPSEEWIKYIRKHGGSFILSGDSHSADTLCFGFDKIKL